MMDKESPTPASAEQQEADLHRQSERQAIRDLCRNEHKNRSAGKITTAAFCVCGSGSGGPCGSPACRALYELEQAEAELASLRAQLQQAQPKAADDILRQEKNYLTALGERDKAVAERLQLHMALLGVFAKCGICTPAEGYLKAPHCYDSNLEELVKLLTTLRAERDRLVGALEGEKRRALNMASFYPQWAEYFRCVISAVDSALTATTNPEPPASSEPAESHEG